MLFNVLINSKKKCVNKINTFKINYSGGSSPTSTLPDIIKELRDFTQNNMNTNIKDFNEKIYIRIFDNVDEAYIVKDNYNLHIPEKYIDSKYLLNDIKSKIGDIHIIFIKDYLERDPNYEEVDAYFNDMVFGSVLIYRNMIFLKNNIDKDEDYIITEINKIEDKKNLQIYNPEGVFESDLYNEIKKIINEPKSNEDELNISYIEDNDTSISSNSNKNNGTSTSSNSNKK